MTRKRTTTAAAPRLPRRLPRPSFPIVGIGASAGGLDAFRRLLGALPARTGMAYVLVQHLDPRHDSILSDLLSESTAMKVSEVRGDIRVEPDHVYVIPPSRGLLLVGGTLKLVARGRAGAAPLAIDSFLRSLAEAEGSQAIGVLLSGTGTDGTLGLSAVAEAGGITFAQLPSSARNGDMPASAIASGDVHFVLTPEDIARELARLGGHPYLAAADEEAAFDESSLGRVLELLRRSHGTDFTHYKKSTLRRRVARRMAVTRVQTLAAYALRLETDAPEAKALYADCLISVTSFFRDPKVFQALSETVLPALLRDRPADLPLRVWVAGCASGEEAYSIAMCLLEATSTLSRNPLLQVFATDLSETALARAREGRYPESIARDVDPERLRRFFSRVSGQYQISKAIREMCVFARHDLTRDPPYSRMDLVSCRNLLIYLEPSLQERVFATLHYALRPQGYLLLGPAETVASASALFATVDEARRIYSSQAGTGPSRLYALHPAGPSLRGEPAPSLPCPPAAADVAREADRMILARLAPAGVVVDEGMRVLEFRGDTEPFLAQGQGKASLNLERLVRKGLLIELRQAVAEARAGDVPVRRAGLHVRHRGEVRRVALEVIPIRGRPAADKCLLVLFERDGSGPSAGPGDPVEGARAGEVARLDMALAQTNDYMHTLVREHEAALEALQSTNEEALSSNEELQSLNEELQTAKEEIQSANEELATLNQELQDRNVQLGRSNDEIQRALDSANGIVDTVPHPLLILDADLRIEKANAAFYGTFQLAPAALGRPLADLGPGAWADPALLAALRSVISSGQHLQELEIAADFPGGPRSIAFSAQRLQPPRGQGGRLLLSIEDRTEARREEASRASLFALEHAARQKAEAADKLKDEFVATVSHELRGPLTVISGWLNLLLLAKGDAGRDNTDAFAAMGRAVKTQARLITDLMDHARLVTGKVELQLGPLDLLALAENALAGVRATAEAKEITVELVGDCPACIVLGDADRLQQVLWNLFFNAIKFTPRGGRVHIGVTRAGEQVRLTVSDDGRGIDGAFLPHVFDRFRQQDGSASRIESGLGLGLTLVRELVELHGGSVNAESPGHGHGATFTVLLPLHAVLGGALPATAGLLERTRVLVVDDEADTLNAIVATLELYGAEVQPAGSVSEAMAALATSVPHVLVSDLGMPGEDGYELMRRVRKLPAESGGLLPSLALTAYCEDGHRARALESGFHQFLEKPVEPARLVAEVARLAGRNA